MRRVSLSEKFCRRHVVDRKMTQTKLVMPRATIMTLRFSTCNVFYLLRFHHQPNRHYLLYIHLKLEDQRSTRDLRAKFFMIHPLLRAWLFADGSQGENRIHAINTIIIFSFVNESIQVLQNTRLGNSINLLSGFITPITYLLALYLLEKLPPPLDIIRVYVVIRLLLISWFGLSEPAYQQRYKKQTIIHMRYRSYEENSLLWAHRHQISSEISFFFFFFSMWKYHRSLWIRYPLFFFYCQKFQISSGTRHACSGT